ncbi:MAG TPA: type II secretion system F family protein [Methanoregulaceae archaeon]|mgnify:FL=1|jgi:flagellar protein FlaJ|nr:type II secretion system F family protein [Methanoregulaceae archaeon]HOB58962.1 type II secretion system F family protein [Methanoregulaceae archaeon]HOW33280.1 type II secretion system F family protein [Methanoregulaceae archaeon]HPW09581.1 type II secretion system F family protein [Methanoregulaceae archaeon]HQM56305.1 type II secretion system F family protein [Methanoregulaceae archaeon]
MNSFQRLAFRILGKYAGRKRDKYSDLRNSLLTARMKIPFEVYLSTAYLASSVIGIVSAILLGTVTWLFNVPGMITYQGEVPEVLLSLNQYSLIIGTLIATIVSFAIVAGIIFLLFLLYPGFVSGNRKRNIESTLPYAINYVTAMSTAGIPPAEIFRQLGSSTIYGESATEARFIALEIDLFGRDLIDALRVVSSTTPSFRMKEFLQGSMGCISAGSNLTEYFRNKAEQYALENRQTQKMFLETLGLIAESYVTAMVAGPLFLIILQSIMSILSSQSQPFMLYIIIYLIIPFGSIAFVILISTMTPES